MVDSLRHGTPVLTSLNSSLREFQHEGVYFFDPRDASTVDLAWQRFQSHGTNVIDSDELMTHYDWDTAARTIVTLHTDHLKGRSLTGFHAD